MGVPPASPRVCRARASRHWLPCGVAPARRGLLKGILRANNQPQSSSALIFDLKKPLPAWAGRGCEVMVSLAHGDPAGQLLPDPGFASKQWMRPWIAGLIGVLAVM